MDRLKASATANGQELRHREATNTPFCFSTPDDWDQNPFAFSYYSVRVYSVYPVGYSSAFPITQPGLSQTTIIHLDLSENVYSK